MINFNITETDKLNSASSFQNNAEKSEKSYSDHEEGESKKIKQWTDMQDEQLRRLVNLHGEKNWRLISNQMQGRNSIQCLHRWSKILKPGLVQGPWSQQEDTQLFQWVMENNPQQWSLCAEFIKGRSGKQCRERYYNNLAEGLQKGNWTVEQDNAIFSGYLEYGSSWSQIAKNLKGRTENSVQNRFYSTVRKLFSDDEKQKENLNDLIQNRLTSNLEMQIKNSMLKNKLLAESKLYHQQSSDDIILEEGKLDQIVLEDQQRLDQEQIFNEEDDFKNKQNLIIEQSGEGINQKKQEFFERIVEFDPTKVKRDQTKFKTGILADHQQQQNSHSSKNISHTSRSPEKENSSEIQQIKEEKIINEDNSHKRLEQQDERADIELNQVQPQIQDSEINNPVQEIHQEHININDNEKQNHHHHDQHARASSQDSRQSDSADSQSQMDNMNHSDNMNSSDEDSQRSHNYQSHSNIEMVGVTGEGDSYLPSKRQYNRKRELEEYSSTNLLYRLLKDQKEDIQRTSCMKDYSVFYQKYKANKYSTRQQNRDLDKYQDFRISNKLENQSSDNNIDQPGQHIQGQPQSQLQLHTHHLHHPQHLQQHHHNQQGGHPDLMNTQGSLNGQLLMNIQHSMQNQLMMSQTGNQNQNNIYMQQAHHVPQTAGVTQISNQGYPMRNSHHMLTTQPVNIPPQSNIKQLQGQPSNLYQQYMQLPHHNSGMQYMDMKNKFQQEKNHINMHSAGMYGAPIQQTNSIIQQHGQHQPLQQHPINSQQAHHQILSSGQQNAISNMASGLLDLTQEQQNKIKQQCMYQSLGLEGKMENNDEKNLLNFTNPQLHSGHPQMVEFQSQIMDFFNQSITEIVKNFQSQFIKQNDQNQFASGQGGGSTGANPNNQPNIPNQETQISNGSQLSINQQQIQPNSNIQSGSIYPNHVVQNQINNQSAHPAPYSSPQSNNNYVYSANNSNNINQQTNPHYISNFQNITSSASHPLTSVNTNSSSNNITNAISITPATVANNNPVNSSSGAMSTGNNFLGLPQSNQQLQQMKETFPVPISSIGKQNQSNQLTKKGDQGNQDPLQTHNLQQLSANNLGPSIINNPHKETSAQPILQAKIKHEQNHQSEILENFIMAASMTSNLAAATSGAGAGGSGNNPNGDPSGGQSSDGKTDQKMIFLLQQLNTLETMLTSTKKQLSRLQASLQEPNGQSLLPLGLHNQPLGPGGIAGMLQDQNKLTEAQTINQSYFDAGVMQVKQEHGVYNLQNQEQNMYNNNTGASVGGKNNHKVNESRTNKNMYQNEDKNEQHDKSSNNDGRINGYNKGMMDIDPPASNINTNINNNNTNINNGTNSSAGHIAMNPMFNNFSYTPRHKSSFEELFEPMSQRNNIQLHIPNHSHPVDFSQIEDSIFPKQQDNKQEKVNSSINNNDASNFKKQNQPKNRRAKQNKDQTADQESNFNLKQNLLHAPQSLDAENKADQVKKKRVNNKRKAKGIQNLGNDDA